MAAQHENGSGDSYVLRNEFAAVRVEVVKRRGTECLFLTDLRTDVSIVLDPLEIESLAWCAHSDLSAIVDPSRSRWGGVGP